MILDDEIIKHLKDSELPEVIRESLLNQVFAEQRNTEASSREKEKLEFEKRKFRWNTPVVVTLTGLLTLGATYLFDVWKAETESELVVKQGTEEAQNTLTLEQLRAEISESETRLSQSFQARQQKSEAEFAALAEERAFQFNLVKEQLASELDQSERARVLLFLAKSGILSTLNVAYLEELANEQLSSDQNIIPRLSTSPSAASWSDLSSPKNSRLWDVGAATARVDSIQSSIGRGICSGFFVRPNQLVTTDHCVGGLTELSALAGYYSISDTTSTTRYALDDLTVYTEMGAGSARSIEISDDVLTVAEDDELRIGLPLVLIHYPEGGVAKVSRCSVVKIAKDEILHECDTLGGSSGGALLSEISLNLVGFHYAGASPLTDQSILAPQSGLVNRAKVFTQSALAQVSN